MMNAQYAKVAVTGLIGNRQITQNYATLIRSNEQYRQAVLRLAHAATAHFTQNRPSFREISGGPFNNAGGAIIL